MSNSTHCGLQKGYTKLQKWQSGLLQICPHGRLLHRFRYRSIEEDRHMGSKRVKLVLVSFAIAATFMATAFTAQAKKKTEESSADEVSMAVVYGMTGERYIFYGTNGITVEQDHHPGMLHSNMSTYRIRIDGSGAGSSAANAPPTTGVAPTATAAAPAKGAFSQDSDFTADPNCSYFVSGTVVCVMPSASGIAGNEIKVCNTGSAKIKYTTRYGETISGSASGEVNNNTSFQVDRFISDGKNWFKE